MPLRYKIPLIIACITISLVASLYAVSQLILLNSFTRIEERQTQENVERVLQAVTDNLTQLDSTAGDWANWDDTYTFAEDGNSAYIATNLMDSALVNLNVNLMLFVNSSGRIVFQKAVDLQQKTEAPFPQELLAQLSANPFLLNNSRNSKPISGLILLPKTSLLVAMRPILTSEGKGPSRGTFIIGRYLNETTMDRLAQTTRLPVGVHPISHLEAADLQAIQPCLAGIRSCVRPLNNKTIIGYGLMPDIYGKPALVLRIELPREIYAQGQTTIFYVALVLILVGLVFSGATLFLLEKQFLVRLNHLCRSIEQIGLTGDSEARVVLTGRDELTSLAGSLNGMLAVLAQYRQHLEELVEARTLELALKNKHLRQEVTERRQVEAELRLSEDKFAQAFQLSPDGMIIIRLADNRIIDVNQGFSQCTGYTAAEVLGRSSLTLDFWVNPMRPASLLQKLREHGEFRDFESQFRTKDRIIKTGLISARMIKIGGEPCILGVIRDISEHKRAEAEREKLVQQLMQAQKMEVVGQLAAGIAHDFNNLLTTVLGFAQLLRMDTTIPEPARTDLGRIVAQGQRGAQLVRQLLDFSRKSISQPQPLDLVPFIKETVKFLQRTIPEDISLVLTIDTPELPLRADPVQLQQVLTNLAINARDAMQAGGELHLRLSPLSLKPGVTPPVPGLSSGEWAVVTVTDSGTGIPAENIPHIFEPFFTTKEAGQGSGLGLAQVYGIVKQHNGHIDVTSQVGQGTTFTLYLPTTFPSVEVAAEPSIESPTQLKGGNGQTILLVEDDPMVLTVTQAMLTQLGYRVLTASNGQRGIEIYQQHQAEIDLVLADVVMPGVNGFTLFETLKTINPEVKVVLVTGYPMDDNKAQNLLAQGLVDWLQKPLIMPRIGWVIERTLNSPTKLEFPNGR